MRLSPVFSVPARVYARALGLRLLRRWAWLPALATLGLLGLSFRDVRFAYVLLMTLFVVYPMLLTLGWLAITGKRHFVRAMRPQRWTFGSGDSPALAVEFFRFQTDDSDEIGEAVENFACNAEAIERIDRSKGYTYVWLRDTGTPLLIIPTELTPQPAE